MCINAFLADPNEQMKPPVEFEHATLVLFS